MMINQKSDLEIPDIFQLASDDNLKSSDLTLRKAYVKSFEFSLPQNPTLP